MLNNIKKYSSLLVIICTLFCCKNKNNKGEYRHTTEIGKELYLEVYRTFGSGAFGGDMISHYLTDTLNFRVCVGEFDNSIEHFSYKNNEDTIEIQKLETSDGGGSFQTISKKNYDIKKLKALQNISKSEIETISDKYLFENN
jgi:hypothetical protein